MIDRVPCPRCRIGRFADEGAASCNRGCRGELLRFSLAEDGAHGAGLGRCARHPGKDAAAGCERCGAFVCDVCLTRTGATVLCPACFDLLHGRGELATTVASRFRLDWFAATLLVLGVPGTGCFIGWFAIPAALALAIWGLRRRKRDPWISVPVCVTTAVVSAFVVAFSVIVIGIAMAN